MSRLSWLLVVSCRTSVSLYKLVCVRPCVRGLLNVLLRLIRHRIFTQLFSYFKECKLLFDNQYGFRPNYSNVYVALELTDIMITQMDKIEEPINIFLDLSKAFDNIDHKTYRNWRKKH